MPSVGHTPTMSRPPWTTAAVIVCALLTVLSFASVGEGASGLPSGRAPSFKVGTTWTYRHTVTSPAGESRTGTMKEVYSGEMTYRGRVYHAVDVSTTVNPSLAERIYHEWAGTHFRQVASVTTDTSNNMAEIVFDRPIDLGIQTNISGTAAIYENGVQRGTAPLTYSASSKGTARVTVPAGTFQATIWDVLLRIGQLETSMSIHAVGIQDVRMESKIFAAGSLASTWSKELVSGPLR